MVRFLYTQQCDPPAPFVYVTLRDPQRAREIADIPAQVDSGADRTVIPAQILATLQLVVLDRITVAGFGGVVYQLDTYAVELEIRQLRALMVEVVAHPTEPFILLGRDVLNQFRVILDGPQLALEID
jgi:hypothetical protein